MRIVYWIMKTFGITCLLFLSISLSSFGQYWNYGFHTNVAWSVGELKENAGSIVFPEFGFSMGYRFFSPLEVGINIGYSLYGTKLEKRTDLYPGFSDELRIRRNNNLVSLMPYLRYYIDKGQRVHPFFEAQIGANHFYTRYTIREFQFEEPIEEGRDYSDWVMAYRFGGGIKIPFKKPENGHWELKLVYHDTGSVEFLRKQDTQYRADLGDGQFVYTPVRSTINLVHAGIGVVFYGW